VVPHQGFRRPCQAQPGQPPGSSQAMRATGGTAAVGAISFRAHPKERYRRSARAGDRKIDMSIGCLGSNQLPSRRSGRYRGWPGSPRHIRPPRSTLTTMMARARAAAGPSCVTLSVGPPTVNHARTYLSGANSEGVDHAEEPTRREGATTQVRRRPRCHAVRARRRIGLDVRTEQ
jgi:hypothetical protein